MACWQLSTEKFVGMFTYTLFMVPSGRQQLVWDLVGGARAPELALELELAAVLDWREEEPREVLALGIMGMVSTWPLPTSVSSFPTPQEQGNCLPWGPSDDSLLVLPGPRESPLLSDHCLHAFKPSPFPPRPLCHRIPSPFFFVMPPGPGRVS